MSLLFQNDSEEKMKEENGADDIISEEKKKPKMKTKTVQNPLEVTSSKKGFTSKELQAAWERENAMVSFSGVTLYHVVTSWSLH